ncbi:MAG TPA: HK97 family phage prohead protease [Lachnospiraceae bacterium]|nr:HK97 family phage prohead protease [Lachnospiraceae bacterium]
MEQNKLDKIMEKVNSGREYRRMEIRVRAVAEENPEPDYTVEGYACTFNEPYELYSFSGYTVREQVDPDAFNECDMSDVIMQFDHQGRVFARLSNNTLQLNTDEHGLRMSANLGGTETGRQLYDEIKGGYITKMSFGFTVDEDKREVTENRETGAVDVLRTITKIRKLYDVSAVSIPANDGTEISARSWCDGVIAELEAERLKSVAIEEARAKALAAINKYHKEVSND